MFNIRHTGFLEKIKIRSTFFLFLFLFFLLSGFSCKHREQSTCKHPGIGFDTLKVVTLYGPTSYFDYRGQPMGIDYENAKKFAEDEGLEFQISAVKNIQEIIGALKSGEAHLAAFPVPSISEYNSEVIHCGPIEVSRQVLIQKKGKEMVKDVTELVGEDVYVERDSKYQYRLRNLNEEIGGGINIIEIDSDTISSEDLFRMVSAGDIGYSVVDSEIASLYKGAFPDLDVSLSLSSDQAASWAVANGLDSLASKINGWENLTHTSDFVKEIYKRYFDRALNEDFDVKLTYFTKRNLSGGNPVSAYDSSFKRYASVAGYDWRLLAAIAYCESGYNPSVASRFGAYGLMQVMPSSASSVGVDPGSLGNPDTNILAAAKILAMLDRSLKKRIEDPEERMKFVVASYNSGLGHIFDSMALAEKNGLDPQKWTGNVSISALMKSRPEYYNDPVVKNGYFRGRETVDFVDHVTSIYNYLKKEIK